MNQWEGGGNTKDLELKKGQEILNKKASSIGEDIP